MSDLHGQLGSSDRRTTAWAHSPQEELPLVLGRYRILDRIGGGGMGTVYRALHVNLKQIVAIKTIRLEEHPERHAALVDRFRREMEAIGAVQHPHVVRATDGGEENGVYFLVMEYVDGIDLGSLSRRLGPLRLADACELIRQAALGVACIHARGLIHRDIKPGNLLLSREGVVRVADLGLARFRAHSSGHSELTPEGQAMGTPDYMAPEQARNVRAADVRSDIYSLGCSLFRLLTGQTPYPSPRFGTYAEKLLAHQSEPVPRLAEGVRAREPGADAAALALLDGVLQRMLAKAPEDRYPDPAGVVEALTPLAFGCDLAGLWGRLGRGEVPRNVPHAGPSSSTDVSREPTRGPEEPDGAGRPAPRPPPPWRRRIAAGALVLAGAALLAAYAGLFRPAAGPDPASLSSVSPGEGAGEAVAPAPRIDLDLLPASLQHDLLEVAPRAIAWTSGDGLPQWRYDPRLRQLSVQTGHLALLQLGETHAPHYALRVGVYQTRWKGGVGIYLGCRLPTGERPGRLQFLELREQLSRGFRRQLNVTRGFLELKRDADGRVTAGQVTSVGSHLLLDVRGEQTLEATVSNGRLKRVRANGVPLGDLVVEDVARHFTSADQSGGFGIIVGGSEGTFRSASFTRLDEAP